MEEIFNYEHPFVCVDAVVFTLTSEKPDSYRKLPRTDLKILVYKRLQSPNQNKWALPGGFLGIDEMPEEKIKKKVYEKTSFEICHLEQIHTFCDTKRDPRARVISIAYLGLISEEELNMDEVSSIWFTLDWQNHSTILFQNGDESFNFEDFAFDHYFIIERALKYLQENVMKFIFSLLPQTFTLTQLQKVYEVIMGKKEQTANFRRKIKDLVVETNFNTKDKGHRPAKMYRKK